MTINNFIDELKKQGAEQFFRDWLFGNSTIGHYDVELYFKDLFGDLRDEICNMRNITDTYRAENNSNQYYINIVVCDKKDLRCYTFENRYLFIKFVYLIFNEILYLRYNSNDEKYFVSNTVAKQKIANQKNWWCGNDYQIYKTFKFKKGALLEKDLNVFQFDTSFAELAVKDILDFLI